jgi:small-conductance mechanosensitive channel
MDGAMRRLLIPMGIALLSAAVLLTLRGMTFRLLRIWADRTEARIDTTVIEVLKTPSVSWCIAIGLYIGIAFSEIPERYIFYISKTIHVIVILSVSLAAANLAGKILKNYTQQQSSLPIPATGLAYGMVKGAIITIGLLISLSVLGISIAPLITALGVGGLAVALALQDTLANLFAGIHILMEKSIRVGDFVKLETGQEGYVEDITWRTTRIKMLSNNVVVIPNNKLSQSVVINYCLPEKRLSIQLLVGVGYASDPECVERILAEEARKAVEEVPFFVGEPWPTITLSGFGENSLGFTIVCHFNEFSDQIPAEHELRKRIFRRFRQEGIEIPFPQRTVHLREERGLT